MSYLEVSSMARASMSLKGKNPLDRPHFGTVQTNRAGSLFFQKRSSLFFCLPLSPVKRILVSTQESLPILLLVLILGAKALAISMVRVFIRVVLFRTIVLAVFHVVFARSR